MIRCLLFFLLVFAASCENHAFDADKRQLIAKDLLRRQLHNARSFDITSFREDTLMSYPDTTFKKPLRYSLNFEYQDSLGQTVSKKGTVIFTPDGRSVINSQIAD